MYNGSRFSGGSILNAAISGIETALWDVKGKILGVPVYQLMGGRCRDRIRVYVGIAGKTPENNVHMKLEVPSPKDLLQLPLQEFDLAHLP